MRLNSEDRQRLHLLEWLYAQPPGGYDVAPFYEHIVQSFDVSRADLLQLKAEGNIDAYFEGGMVGRATITPHGRAYVDEVRRRRGNRTDRRWACRCGFLGWLEHQGADTEGSVTHRGGFRDDELADFYGESPANDEIDAAAAWLMSEGLIGGWGPEEMAGPLLAYLTHAGLDCLDQFDGDVRKWNAARRHVAGSGMTINVVGVAQIATGADSTQQLEVHTAVTEVRREVEGLVEVLRAFGVQDAHDLLDLYYEAVAENASTDERGPLVERFAQRAKDLVGQVAGDSRASVVSMLVSWVVSNAHSVINVLH